MSASWIREKGCQKVRDQGEMGEKNRDQGAGRREKPPENSAFSIWRDPCIWRDLPVFKLYFNVQLRLEDDTYSLTFLFHTFPRHYLMLNVLSQDHNLRVHTPRSSSHHMLCNW